MDDLKNIYSRLGSLEEGQKFLNRNIQNVAVDVKSLLASRSYFKGAWRSIIIVSSVVSALIGLLVGPVLAWWKGS